MREIKFRAWSNRDKCWCGAFAIHKDGMFRESPLNPWIDLDKQDEIVLMQYTGLKDKNGKEIYEGDIVKIPDDYEEYGFMAGEQREVYYCYGCFRLKPKHEHIIKRGNRGHTIEYDMDLCEIIGNIYENPELLTR